MLVLSRLLSHAIKLNFISMSNIELDRVREAFLSARRLGDRWRKLFTKSHFVRLYVICIFIRGVTSMFSLLYDNESR